VIWTNEELFHSQQEQKFFDVEYIYGFVWWGSASKVHDVTA